MESGIRIEETRDAGNRWIESFAILPEMENTAADHLIFLLPMVDHISLSNDEDEGHEGTTLVRDSSPGFEVKNGGHGWQGEWTPMTHDEVRRRILELAPLNSGGHWSCQGSITRPKE